MSANVPLVQGQFKCVLIGVKFPAVCDYIYSANLKHMIFKLVIAVPGTDPPEGIVVAEKMMLV